MVLIEKWLFFQLYFLGNIGQENVFYNILERKKAFLGYKNKKFKKSKNWHFSKRLTHGLGPKKAIFLHFLFLGIIGQENVFDDILQRKNALLGNKQKNFKKSKNWHFSKGVNPWFLSKDGHFSNFFFLSKRDKEKSFHDLLERKNAFLGYKKKEVKKVEKLPFFQRGLSTVLVQNWPFLQLHFFRQYRPGKYR